MTEKSEIKRWSHLKGFVYDEPDRGTFHWRDEQGRYWSDKELGKLDDWVLKSEIQGEIDTLRSELLNAQQSERYIQTKKTQYFLIIDDIFGMCMERRDTNQLAEHVIQVIASRLAKKP